MKNLKTVLLGIFMCVSMIGFTACGDDDDPKPEPKPQEKITEVTYEFKCSADLFENANLQAYYKDKDGKEQVETIEGGKWSKNVKEIRPPFKANLRVVMGQKADFKPTKDVYDIDIAMSISSPGVSTSNQSYSFSIGKEAFEGFIADKELKSVSLSIK